MVEGEGVGVEERPGRVERGPLPPVPRVADDGVADGGQVRMPLAKTFFSPSFGMLADKFGVGWMVIVHA